MGMPAARTTDMHVCPMVTGVVPHVGGPCLPGSTNVLINCLPAERKGDKAICVGPPDTIVGGSATVKINGQPAARVLDAMAHGGKIVMGSPNVFIG